MATTAQTAKLLLTELRELEWESLRRESSRKVDVLDRVRAAIRGLGELGSPEAILARAATELGVAADADRVLISQVLDGGLHPRALWHRDDPQPGLGDLAGGSTALTYPLVEADLVAAPRARAVDVAAVAGRSPAVLRTAFGWTHYVVAGLNVDGVTIGMLHLETSGSSLDDLQVADLCADGLAATFEIAVLRRRVREHRDEHWAAVHWISERLDAAEAADSGLEEAFTVSRESALTPRERDVVELLTQGMTNAAIARALVIGEGTVKYHLSNAFRKLNATSRADAVARYLRGA